VRGDDNRTGKLFSYVNLEARVRRDHPLRAIRTIVNEALSAMEREFSGLYSPIGRPSIPSEKLLRAMLCHWPSAMNVLNGSQPACLQPATLGIPFVHNAVDPLLGIDQ